MKRVGFIFILTLLFIPYFSSASVYISEVAWMGTNDNANAEWIELYNDGTETNIDGWTLEAVDGQPAIELSGTVRANGYALLERTSDETVPSVDAYLVYTGSLANSGELLELRDDAGTIVDAVDGRDEWSVGGDNDTKETLQRSGNPPTGSWTTGPATPHGDAYIKSEETDTSSENEDEHESETSESQTQFSGGGNVIYGKKEDTKEPRREPALTLDIGFDKTVVVGVPTTFTARGYNESGRPLTVLDVVWNFGDGATEKGAEAIHTFWHTGSYVVTATGTRKNFTRDVEDTAQIIVHVIEPPVTVTDMSRTHITLTNNSKETVDISGCVFVSGDDHFAIPENTHILGSAEVTFPKKITNLRTDKTVHLFDPHGSLLATYGSEKEQQNKVASVSYRQVTPQQGAEPVTNVETDTMEMSEIQSEPRLLATAGTYNEASGSPEDNMLGWWILALFTVIVTAIVAVTLVRREQQEVIEGFYIESEE
jgi:hypothetical protein